MQEQSSFIYALLLYNVWGYPWSCCWLEKHFQRLNQWKNWKTQNH